MPSVKQHLWFEKDMEAAIRFYTGLIPGSTIDWITGLPVDSPSGPAGNVQLAAFSLGDQHYMAINGGPMEPFNHSFSIIVECDDQAELDRLWEALSDGGQVEQCGWLRDRWGLSWQIVPKRLGELMMAGPEQAQRVGAAMMGMVKFDIAGLEAAARGE